MDALTARMDALFADARRAATPGSIGQPADRPGEVIVDPVADPADRALAPSASALSVAIDGPGLFVVEGPNGREYTRLGDFRFNTQGFLVDGRGRFVLGYDAGGSSTKAGLLDAVRIQRDHKTEPSRVTIDASGVIKETSNRADPDSATAGGSAALGRIALAIFPAPTRLRRVDEFTAEQSAASGPPTIVSPGEPNVGTLSAHTLDCSQVDLQGDLAAIWRLSRIQDVDVALRGASDLCARTATELVK